MEGLLIFGGIIAIFSLIGWISEKISEYREAERTKQRDEIAANVISESGINEANHAEVSEKFKYVTKNLFIRNAETESYEIVTPTPEPRRVGMLCPKCQAGYLVRRQGRYGSFLGCTRYPACNSTKPVGWVNKRAKEVQESLR